MDLGTDDPVWYAAYGSNLAGARFGCYLAGGRPPGAARTYAGARDRTAPRRDVAIPLPGGLCFAGRSQVWGGGIAFYDPRTEATVAARAYLVSFGQFSDVVSQEARRPVADDLVLAGPERRWPVPSGVYESVLHVDDLDGIPVLTITSLQDLDPVPPSAAYLRTILTGLEESWDWGLERRVDYLLAARGVGPAWDRRALTELAQR